MDQDRLEQNKDKDDNNTVKPKEKDTGKEITRFRVEPKEMIDETEKERMQKDAEKFEVMVNRLLAEKDRPDSTKK